ncbi:MAG: metal-dependent hydrolase [Candidatus Micrarchaeota archaeon]
MKYYQHIAIGFLANGLAFGLLVQAKLFNPSVFYDVSFAFQVFLAIFLFSILPDVDSIGSFASKIFRFALLLSAGFFAWEFYATRNPSSLIKILAVALVAMGHFLYAKRGRMHRQFPHTLAFGVLACVAIFALTGSKTVALSGGIAFLSHLLADGRLLQFRLF